MTVNKSPAKRLFASTLAIALGLQSAVFASQEPPSLEALPLRLTIGETLFVTAPGGETVSGRLSLIAPGFLSLTTEAGERQLAASNIDRIALPARGIDDAMAGLVWGFLGGAGTGAVSGAVKCSRSDCRQYWSGTGGEILGQAAIGSLIGMLVGFVTGAVVHQFIRDHPSPTRNKQRVVRLKAR